MARSEARIFTSIWSDPDFRALSPAAQHMYLFLLSQPDLSHCGVIAFRPARWAQMAAGLTVAGVEAAVRELEAPAPPFVLTDRVSGELMLRSLLRRDGMLTSPKMVRPVHAALGAVESASLRAALAGELERALADGHVHDEYISPRKPKNNRAARSVTAVMNDLRGRRRPELTADTLPDTQPDRVPDTPSDTLSACGDVPGTRIADTLSDRVSDTLADTHPDTHRDRDYVPVPQEPSLRSGSFTEQQGEFVPSLRSGTNSPSEPSVRDAGSLLDRPGGRDDVERLCQHLADRVEEQTGARPAIGVQWRRAARLLLDADQRTEDQVRAAIDWCQADEFWRANVLSMPKLRAKYIQLRAAAQRGRPATRPDADAWMRVRPPEGA
jgi:hypothetical protein